VAISTYRSRDISAPYAIATDPKCLSLQPNAHRPAGKSAAREGTFCGIIPTGVILMRFQRITVDPQVCTGKPCIRGLRFPVSRLLGLLASGETKEDILRSYPYLEAADVEEALLFAACLADDETVEFAR